MSVKNGDERRIIRIQNRSLSACRNDKPAACLVKGYPFDIATVNRFKAITSVYRFATFARLDIP